MPPEMWSISNLHPSSLSYELATKSFTSLPRKYKTYPFPQPVALNPSDCSPHQPHKSAIQDLPAVMHIAPATILQRVTSC